MIKKTYGASGFMDWVAIIPAGGSKVRVHFTGGALTAYGVTPAEFSTSNPFFQHVIENSQYYADGRISLLRQVEMPDPTPAKATPTPAQEATPAPADVQPAAPQQLAQVEVTCLQDAKDYLQENFGIANRNVRNRDVAKVLGLEHGIEFKGL